MDETLAKELNLRRPKESPSIKWTDCITRVDKKNMRINVTIMRVQKTKSLILQNVRTVNDLKLQALDLKMLEYMSMQNLELQLVYTIII